MSELERRIAGPPPPEIAALGPEALARLDGLVAAASENQRRELAGALGSTLRIVPRPLRPVIKRIVGVR